MLTYAIGAIGKIMETYGENELTTLLSRSVPSSGRRKTISSRWVGVL